MKPGKINTPFRLGASGARSTKEVQAHPTIAVWDDFQGTKKARTKPKREYEKGQGKRMVPRQGSLTFRGDEIKNSEELPEKSVLPTEILTEVEVIAHDALQDGPSEKLPSRSNYDELEKTIGYSFRDRSTLQRALTHRSALAYKDRTDYERLEFLGDAVLDLAVAHLLSVMHLEAREGELSKMRAALVNTQALATIARGLGLGSFIRLGRGEFSSGGHERPSILADVMEAIIGAIYWDSTYDTVFQVVEQIFGQALQEVTPSDPKTELQELLHLTGSEPPSYLLELVEGPEHAPTFVTVVLVDEEVVGRGRGPTKKAAQQAAAAQALVKINPSVPEVFLAEQQNALIPEAFLSVHLILSGVN